MEQQKRASDTLALFVFTVGLYFLGGRLKPSFVDTVGDDFRIVGRVKDAHGLKGEIWVVLFAGQADWLKDMKETGGFFLSKTENLPTDDVKATLHPYSLKGVRAHKNGLILQTPEIADRTAAEGFKGWFLAIPEAYLISDEGESFYLSEIDGFEVQEEGKGIGTVIGFSSNNAQDLLIVELLKGVRPGVKTGDKIEIPFVEALIAAVDSNSETIEVDLPNGLIEVQLGLDSQESVDESDDGLSAELDEDELDADDTDEDMFDDLEDEAEADDDASQTRH